MSNYRNNKTTVNGYTFKIVMGNPKLRKVMEDAYNSPVGSTKRKKAMAMVNSFRTVAARNGIEDGQGGYGLAPDLWRGIKNVASGVANTYSNVSNWKTNTADPAMIKAQTSLLTAPGSALEWGVDRVYRQGEQPISWSQTGGQSVKNLLNSVLIPGGGNIQQPQQQQTSKPQVVNNQMSSRNQAPTSDNAWLQAINGNTNPFGVSFLGSAPKNNKSSQQVSSGVSYLSQGPAQEQQSSSQSDTSGWYGEQTAGSSTSSSGYPDAASLEKNEFITQLYNNLPENAKAQYKPIFDNLLAGIGSDASTYAIMNDEEKLATLFPGVPKDQLPTGANLLKQLDKLYDQQKSAMGLDVMENRIMTMSNQAGTLDSDIEAYMKGKDENLSIIDGMLDEAKSKITTLDMGNPYVEQQYNQYINYLTTLRGRTQQRYIDVLNTSVKAYSTQLESMVSLYNTKKEDLVNKYNTAAEITKDEYDWAKTAIKGLYDSLDQLQDKALNTQTAKMNILATYNSTMLDAADALDDNGKSNTTDGKIPTPEQIKSFLDIMGLGNYIAAKESDSNSNPDPSITSDFYNSLNQATNANYSTDAYLGILGSKIQDQIYGLVSGGKETQAINAYKQFFQSFTNDFESLDPISAQKRISDLKAMATSFNNGFKNGLSSWFNDPAKLAKVMEVINDLKNSTKGWFGSTKQLKEKSEFLKDAAEKGIPTELANIIYDNVKNNMTNMSIDRILANPDTVAQELGGYIDVYLANKLNLLGIQSTLKEIISQ